MGNAVEAMTKTFALWNTSYTVDNRTGVDDLLQLVARAVAVACRHMAVSGSALSEQALSSLTALSKIALRVTENHWQLPLAATELVTSLVESNHFQVIHDLLGRLDNCCLQIPENGITLRAALKQMLQDALSEAQSSRPGRCHNSTITTVLHVARLEYTTPLLLVVAPPAVLQHCAGHKAAAVRKAACSCFRVMIQQNSLPLKETDSADLRARLQQWSVTGLVKVLRLDSDCTVRIHACHETRGLLNCQINGSINLRDAGDLLVMHLGAVASRVDNKRVLMAASKDLISLSTSVQANGMQENEVGHHTSHPTRLCNHGP